MFGRRDPYRRQIRRTRRNWRNRDNDAYPLLILGPDEPLALIALSAFGRWAFRHRSAFAPFIIALAAFMTAASLHGHHARWGIPAAAMTATATILLAFPHALPRRHPAGAAVAGILARTWEACGIDRAIERAYAGIVIAVTGDGSRQPSPSAPP